MKFKENAIKPRMVIHCPSDEEAMELMKHLREFGYTMFNRGDPVKDIVYANEDYGGTVYYLDSVRDKTITFSSLRRALKSGYKPTEFSDLIESDGESESISLVKFGEEIAKGTRDAIIDAENSTGGDMSTEMSAVEVLEWLNDKSGSDTMAEVFGIENGTSKHRVMEWFEPQEIVDKIITYEAAKKEKPVELEWVNVVRIMKVTEDYTPWCVHEEELPDGEKKIPAEEILRKYMSMFDGDYYAVTERRCRAKGE